MTVSERPMGEAAPSLERDAIGLPEVLFQSITHMAPAVATALSIGAATSFAGGITPLAVLFAMIAVLFTAYSMAQLAKHLPSAGGMFTYVRNGLGPFFGWLVAWGFALAEPLVMPLLLGGFGFYGAIFLSTYLSINFEYAWLGLAVLCGLVVWWLTYRGIGISTRTGIVLGVIEIVIFLLISALLIVNADQNTLNVFLPGADGVRPAFQGMIFCLLAFIGFEAAAPMGEEARRPRWAVPRAVIGSCFLVGLFYLFCSYAWVIGTGFDNFTADTLAQADPWRHLATIFWSGGWVLIFFAIINSALANSNAGVNAASRVIYAMGRNGVLPRAFASTHPQHKTPHVAIIAQTILGISVALLLGWKWSPLNAFGTLSYALTSLVIVVYITVCVSCVVYFHREHRAKRHVWLHVVFPVAGALAFLPPLYYQFRPLPPEPLRYGNFGAIALFCFAALVTLWMATRHRERLNADHFFIAGAEPEEAPPQTGAAPVAGS